MVQILRLLAFFHHTFSKVQVNNVQVNRVQVGIRTTLLRPFS